LVRRHGLAPPVDVHVVAAQFAELEWDDLPGECDGLVVRLDAAGKHRPLIVVGKTPNTLRERFTVAHELGHVLLPWHIGTNIACDTNAEMLWNYGASEAEANRFAAELLVPSEWLVARITEREGESMQVLINDVREAGVSAHVACIALANSLPPGHVFALLGEGKQVELAGTSRRTGVEPPPSGTLLGESQLDKFADRRDVVRYGSRRMIWWRFRSSGRPAEDEDMRDSKSVLASLLDAHAAHAGHRESLQRSFAGIAGAAKSMGAFEGEITPAELHARLRRAMTKKREHFPPSLFHDPDLAVWLRKRAAELAGAQPSPRPRRRS
jgi:hypothetical protein